MNLNEVAVKALNISLKRQRNGADLNVANILKHCAGEVVEAQESFLIWNYDQERTSFANYAEELADIVICALIAAARDGVNIEAAVEYKMAKNAERADGRGGKL